MIVCWAPLEFHNLAKINWSLTKTVAIFLLFIMETIIPSMSSMKQVSLLVVSPNSIRKVVFSVFCVSTVRHRSVTRKIPSTGG